jgi:hypothetical protein
MEEKKTILLIDDGKIPPIPSMSAGNYPDLPKEVVDKVQKMDNVSMMEVEKMVYEYHQNNYEKSLGRKKVRKCSNKKYVKRKKAKNGRRSSKR